MVEKARNASNTGVRTWYWREAERILLDRGPVLPLWSTTSSNLVAPELQGFYANPLDQHDLRALKWDTQ